MAKRLVAASRRPLAALALLGALCACASTSAERPTVQPAGWRIVERTGEARYLPPNAASWLSTTIGEALADGSEVSTGRGGRLILDGPGRHISVGPDSRFVLPDGERDDRLEQGGGSLRYRVAEAAQPLRIHTRSLELELLAGVVDVQVNHLATEVAVKEGRVRVATPDGMRQTQMVAGQSAHAAGSDDVQLAVRQAPGAALQPVESIIVPAIQPKSTPAEKPTTVAQAPAPTAEPNALPPSDAASAPPGDPAVQGAPALLHQATPEARPQIAAATGVEVPSAGGDAADDEVGSAVSAPPEAGGPGALEPDGPAKWRVTESPAAAIRRGKFERLTAGMLDQVEASQSSPDPTSGVSR
jgi:hypothetical protein